MCLKLPHARNRYRRYLLHKTPILRSCSSSKSYVLLLMPPLHQNWLLCIASLLLPSLIRSRDYSVSRQIVPLNQDVRPVEERLISYIFLFIPLSPLLKLNVLLPTLPEIYYLLQSIYWRGKPHQLPFLDLCVFLLHLESL